MMDRYVKDLPKGRVDLRCLDCGEFYEFNNWREYGDDSDRYPSCPSCNSLMYKRVYLSFPYFANRCWSPPVDPFHKPLQPGGEYSDSEYQAMAIAHMANTGERVSWQEIKREVSRKYWGVSGGDSSGGGGDK